MGTGEQIRQLLEVSLLPKVAPHPSPAADLSATLGYMRLAEIWHRGTEPTGQLQQARVAWN